MDDAVVVLEKIIHRLLDIIEQLGGEREEFEGSVAGFDVGGEDDD